MSLITVNIPPRSHQQVFYKASALTHFQIPAPSPPTSSFTHTGPDRDNCGSFLKTLIWLHPFPPPIFRQQVVSLSQSLFMHVSCRSH